MLPACDAKDTDNQNTTLLPGTNLLLADQAVSGHGQPAGVIRPRDVM